MKLVDSKEKFYEFVKKFIGSKLLIALLTQIAGKGDAVGLRVCVRSIFQ